MIGGRRNIVQDVTRRYMMQNKKRTFTTWIGIVFMVMLMTCVFVGKDTAIGFLQTLGSQKEGKWHVRMHDLTADECNTVKNLPYVKEVCRTVSLGMTDFDKSENKERPFLNVKAYEPAGFDWMNVQLTEGRLPENAHEIVISEKAIQENADISLGDTIHAKYFDRSVTALRNDLVFPYFFLSVKKNTTVSVPQNFPYYGSNKDFKDNKEYTGQEGTYKLVGVIREPSYETEGSYYTAFTLYDTSMQGTCNLTMLLDLKKLPAEKYKELQDIAGSREMEYNDTVMVFSGDSSDSTFNYMVVALEVFFVVFIMAASMVLIYNVFNLSFRERSVYLGMLSSVGATARQKRSSVYYEATVLLIPALPVGILGGVGLVYGGMLLIKPYLVQCMAWGTFVDPVPVSIHISGAAIGLILGLSVCTVLISAFLPAGKVAKIGAIDSIRGNTDRKQKTYPMQERKLRRGGAEGLLARAFTKRQAKKSGSIRKAITVFLVIFATTTFGAQIVNQIMEKKLASDNWVIQMPGESGVLYCYGNEQAMKQYQALVAEIKKDPDTEKYEEWYTGMWAFNVPQDVYSKEYRDAYRDILNQYYDHALSDQEVEELTGDTNLMDAYVPDDATLAQIAKKLGVDMDKLQDAEHPGVIVLQGGKLSTDSIMAGSGKAKTYRYYDIRNMISGKVGDEIPATVYSDKTEKEELYPLTIAGIADAAMFEKTLHRQSEHIGIIMSRKTLADIVEKTQTERFEPELHIKIRKDGDALREKLDNFSDVEKAEDIFYVNEQTLRISATIRDAVKGVVHVLLICFVLLTSIICMLNLYNSVVGRMEDRKSELAVLQSVGMTRQQMKEMLIRECLRIETRSCIVAVICSGMCIGLIYSLLSSLFGRLTLELPVMELAGVMCLTAMVVIWMTLHAFSKVKGENILENIRQESI